MPQRSLLNRRWHNANVSAGECSRYRHTRLLGRGALRPPQQEAAPIFRVHKFPQTKVVLPGLFTQWYGMARPVSLLAHHLTVATTMLQQRYELASIQARRALLLRVPIVIDVPQQQCQR